MKKSIQITGMLLLPLALLTFTLTACGDSAEEPSQEHRENSVSRSIDITPAEKEASVLSNRFAWTFLRKCMSQNDDNVVLSPVSANICLSMLANGAAGKSRTQILEALGADDMGIEDVNSLNRKLAKQLCGLDDNVTLSMANSFWYSEGVHPKADFINDLSNNYEIETYNINKDTFAADVNQWCYQKTNGLIPHIMDDDAYEEFAILNALYFKGYWNSQYRFDKKDTKKGEFTNSDGFKTDVDYMHKKGLYKYISTDQWRAMCVPFGGGGFNYSVILPNEGYSITKCIESIKDFEPATAQYGVAHLDVKLPKLKINKEQDLIEVLKAMGVTDIFDEMTANLSNMNENAMFVDMAKQNVSFEVDEEGAEGAAVTVVGGIFTTSVGTKEPEYQPFYVDRPFIFMISERSTGAILFLGRINKFWTAQLH